MKYVRASTLLVLTCNASLLPRGCLSHGIPELPASLFLNAARCKKQLGYVNQDTCRFSPLFAIIFEDLIFYRRNHRFKKLWSFGNMHRILHYFFFLFFFCLNSPWKGEIDTWKSDYFTISRHNSGIPRDRKKCFGQNLLTLIRTLIWRTIYQRYSEL